VYPKCANSMAMSSEKRRAISAIFGISGLRNNYLEWLSFPAFKALFVSAPECRDIETALYDRTCVRPYVRL